MTPNSVSCRQLMKDGRWLVPEDQRPANWRSMGILESEEPILSGSVQTVEVSVKNSTETTVTETTKKVSIKTEPPKEITAPAPLPPEKTPVEQDLLDFVIRIHSTDEEISDDELDHEYGRLQDLSDRVKAESLAKSQAAAIVRSPSGAFQKDWMKSLTETLVEKRLTELALLRAVKSQYGDDPCGAEGNARFLPEDLLNIFLKWIEPEDKKK